MTNSTIKIHNVETGKIIERERTVEEISRRELNIIEAKKLAQDAETKAALLSKLGITEDEARLLLGGN